MFKIQFINRLTMQSTGGSVVEFSPATREARVRFPASAIFFLFPFFVFCFALNDVNLWLVTPRIFLKIWFVFIQKKIYPTFSETFLGDSGPFPANPNPFSWKEGNCEVVIMNKIYIIFIFSCTYFQEFTRRFVLMVRSQLNISELLDDGCAGCSLCSFWLLYIFTINLLIS